MIPAPRDPRADADRFYVTDARADRDELAALIAKHDGNIMAAFRAIMAMPKEQQDRLLAQARRMTITAPLWGVALGFLVVFACLFYGAWNEEERNAEADVRRHRHLSDDEIDNDYAAGE